MMAATRFLLASLLALGAWPFIAVSSLASSSSLPSRVLIDVPFTSQAPYGNWKDPRQQDGCEEAVLTMARAWFKNTTLTKAQALQSILGAWNWEVKYLGGHPSLDTADTIRLAAGYFGLKTQKKSNVTINDLKTALARGQLVIVPVNGRAVGNPHYTSPGPPEHMLLLIGYDDATQTFITNDNGTSYGQGYRFKYQTLFNAMREYPTGVDSQYKDIKIVQKNVILVSR